MRTVRLLLRRAAAYAIDVVILAAVLIPLTFGIQAVTGYQATTGPAVWIATIMTISVPSWTYFAISDASARGATLGKRLLGLRAARAVDGARLGPGRALARTAVKLIPWELTHLAAFGLSTQLGTFSPLQIVLLSGVYVLLAVYLVVAALRRGERSLHDLVVGSAVVRVEEG